MSDSDTNFDGSFDDDMDDSGLRMAEQLDFVPWLTSAISEPAGTEPIVSDASQLPSQSDVEGYGLTASQVHQADSGAGLSQSTSSGADDEVGEPISTIHCRSALDT